MMRGHDRRQATCTRMALGSGLGMVEQWSAGAYCVNRKQRGLSCCWPELTWPELLTGLRSPWSAAVQPVYVTVS